MIAQILSSIRVGWFLAIRQIRRSSVWTTVLIIFIMSLTFLNLVVVGGILVGLPVGATIAYNRQYSGDIILRDLPTKDYIAQSELIVKTVRNFPEVESLSARFIGPGKVEANYKTMVGPNQNPDSVATQVTGINPSDEESVTHMGALMREGEMLKGGEEGYIMIGKNLLDQYTLGPAVISATTLKGVHPGSRVRVIVGGHTQEFTVKGILGAKAGEVSTRVFVTDTELRKLLGRTDRNVDEIAIRLKDSDRAMEVRSLLVALGMGTFARVETSRESQGSFLDDIERTFVALSSVIGGIGLAVASITIFIVIFINAVTRQKYIGIMKGIGITALAIEFSYVLQSIFYATIGSSVGLIIVYGLLSPYFSLHPIDFPFADGILLVPIVGTLEKSAILILVTVVAGYFPARMIVKKNTLDAILGR
jgi:ABC-type lipoprotein release transport system permease subunit